MSASEEISVYYHTHWDREWYLPFRTYQVRLAEVVDEILDHLESGRLPCFMLDGQTVVLEDYLELRPGNRARLEGLVRSGKLSIGPWFVMPDEFLVGGESLVRNLARGIEESRAWGCGSFTGYLPDTFGHTADMPTILRGCGLASSVVWRGIDPPKNLFRWESPSGDSVLTYHLTDGYFQMMFHDWTLSETGQGDAVETLIGKIRAVSAADQPMLVPIGGDHLAPITAEGYQRLKSRVPKMTETTPDQYLKTIRTDGLDTVSGELVGNTGSFLLPGVYSSRLYLKQRNRRLEHRLTRVLEPMLAMGQLLAAKNASRYPVSELDLAWKTLMLNHPHDSICGCSVDEVHRENEVRFDQVEQLAAAVGHRVRHHLDLLAGDDEWLVVNTGDRPYTGVIVASEDEGAATGLMQLTGEETALQDEYLHTPHRIPLSHLTVQRRTGAVWVEDVPALGMKRVAKQGTLPAGVRPVNVQHAASETALENEHLRIVVDAEGGVSVTEKASQKTHENFIRFRLQPDQGDSYNSAPVPGSAPSASVFTGLNILLEGPLLAAVELHFTVTHRDASGEENAIDVDLQLKLAAGANQLELATSFINTLSGYKFQLGFATGNPLTQVAAESHFSVVTRHYDPDYREADHMPAEKWKELKTNTGPVQRFFSANGHSWITEGLSEYEVYQNDLFVTLHRGFSYLSKADTGVRGAQAGPPLPTFEGECIDRLMTGRMAWLPTPEPASDLYEAANRFYGCVSAATGKAQGDKSAHESAQRLARWDNPSVVSSACRWVPEAKALELRLINTTNAPQAVKLECGFQAAKTEAVNFLGESAETLPDGALTFAPFAVRTVRFCLL